MRSDVVTGPFSNELELFGERAGYAGSGTRCGVASSRGHERCCGVRVKEEHSQRVAQVNNNGCKRSVRDHTIELPI